MVVSTSYFFDSVLGHRFKETEVPEVIDISFHADSSEKKGACHVNLSFGVGDGSMGPCRGYFFDNSSEASNGHGLTDDFAAWNSEFSFLVPSPGVNLWGSFLLNLFFLGIEE